MDPKGAGGFYRPQLFVLCPLSVWTNLELLQAKAVDSAPKAQYFSAVSTRRIPTQKRKQCPAGHSLSCVTLSLVLQKPPLPHYFVHRQLT